MIRKRIKKIGKLMGLISIRQGWKLGVNIYQLIQEPYLTLETIREEKDKSQIALLILTILSPALVYSGVRIAWDWLLFGRIIYTTGIVFSVAATIQLIFLLYIGYWSWKVIKK